MRPTVACGPSPADFSSSGANTFSVASSSHVALYLRLRDRFADHGLVGVLIAERRGDVLEVHSWLMSCRVIGKTAESKFMERLTPDRVDRGRTS